MTKEKSLSRDEKISILEKRLDKYPEMLSMGNTLEILGISKRRLNELVLSGELKPLRWEIQKHKKFAKLEIISFLIEDKEDTKEC